MTKPKANPRTRGPKPVKGMTRRSSKIVSIRVTLDQERRLKAIAAKQHLTPGDVLRAALDMVVVDPGGFVRGMWATAREDFTGEQFTVERILVEEAGQERLPGIVT